MTAPAYTPDETSAEEKEIAEKGDPNWLHQSLMGYLVLGPLGMDSRVFKSEMMNGRGEKQTEAKQEKATGNCQHSCVPRCYSSCAQAKISPTHVLNNAAASQKQKSVGASMRVLMEAHA